MGDVSFIYSTWRGLDWKPVPEFAMDITAKLLHRCHQVDTYLSGLFEFPNIDQVDLT